MSRFVKLPDSMDLNQANDLRMWLNNKECDDALYRNAHRNDSHVSYTFDGVSGTMSDGTAIAIAIIGIVACAWLLFG